jgi:hypothetical protein
MPKMKSIMIAAALTLAVAAAAQAQVYGGYQPYTGMPLGPGPQFVPAPSMAVGPNADLQRMQNDLDRLRVQQENDRQQQQWTEQNREFERFRQPPQSPTFVPYNPQLMPGITPQGYPRY